MGFLKRQLGRKKQQKANIVFLGATGAGKTTFIQYLETGKPVEEDTVLTTLGIDNRKNSIEMEGWKLYAVDIGGQELYQKSFWNLGMGQASAVVYLIDGTIRPVKDADNFEFSLFSFEYMLQILPPIKPLLILINKQDLIELDPLTTDEAIELYPLRNLWGRSVNVLPTSAKYGDGVDIAMKWLVSKLDE
ncbi:MAG: ADP-ribosylation factor-like protein [Candidatus Hodarchaeales archaeon]|jgi:small GTP-binding protein